MAHIRVDGKSCLITLQSLSLQGLHSHEDEQKSGTLQRCEMHASFVVSPTSTRSPASARSPVRGLLPVNGFLSRLRRRRLLTQPFPAEWLRIIDHEIALCGALPAADRAALCPLVQRFCSEKKFHGCAGFSVGQRERVVIAAQACILLLHRETELFPDVHAVLVYPEPFVVPTREWSADGMVVTEGSEARIGEAGDNGQVVLSWQDIESDLANPGHGHNVVLHEFAHQLDLENGASDGTPRLADHAAYQAWARELQAEYDHLRAAADAGRHTFIDPYAAEHPAEFFAVVSEYFFDLPGALKDRHPRLYEQFQHYYLQDPASWCR